MKSKIKQRKLTNSLHKLPEFVIKSFILIRNAQFLMYFVVLFLSSLHSVIISEDCQSHLSIIKAMYSF